MQHEKPPQSYFEEMAELGEPDEQESYLDEKVPGQSCLIVSYTMLEGILFSKHFCMNYL